MECKECGKESSHEYFCPKCQEKFNKRKEFREIMQKLKDISDLEYPESLFMSGFSYAELEHFSLVFKKLIKKYHLPTEDADFVNSQSRDLLTKIQNTIFW